MKRFLLALVLIAGSAGASFAQQTNIYWQSGTPGTPTAWGALSTSNPMPVTATFTPSGTQNVNLTQILGAAPSASNPLYMAPANGATFPIAGTISGTVNIGNTPNTTPILTQSSFTPNNITTSTTTVVKSGTGVLHGVTVNTLGTVASVVTIYDNTAASGTKIGSVNSLTLSGSFFFDVGFTTGLTVVTTGAPDITVSYR